MGNVDWNEVLETLKMDMTNLVIDLIVVLIVILLASLLIKHLNKTTGKVMEKAQVIDLGNKNKDLITSMTLVRSVGRYFIWFAAFAIIINQLGYGSVLSNLVTAAGIGALAISLGAQSIIKDVVAGLFIMFEKQYSVGDYVSLAGNEGIVTSIAMRCTYLQSPSGQRIIVPNGQITVVTNYTTDNNMAILDFEVINEDDMQNALKIVDEVATQYFYEHTSICFERPNTVIRKLTNEKNKVTVYMKCRGGNQFTVQNELRTSILERFEKEEVETENS